MMTGASFCGASTMPRVAAALSAMPSFTTKDTVRVPLGLSLKLRKATVRKAA